MTTLLFASFGVLQFLRFPPNSWNNWNNHISSMVWRVLLPSSLVVGLLDFRCSSHPGFRGRTTFVFIIVWHVFFRKFPSFVWGESPTKVPQGAQPWCFNHPKKSGTESSSRSGLWSNCFARRSSWGTKAGLRLGWQNSTSSDSLKCPFLFQEFTHFVLGFTVDMFTLVTMMLHVSLIFEHILLVHLCFSPLILIKVTLLVTVLRMLSEGLSRGLSLKMNKWASLFWLWWQQCLFLIGESTLIN